MERIITAPAAKAQGEYTPIKVVNIFITLLLMFGFGLLPPFSTLTPVGMKLLGIFLGVVYGYTTCGIIWPSLFAIIAFGMSGYSSMDDALASMLGQSTVFQSIMANIAGGALSYYGFGKWFVRWSLSKKIFKGKPLLYVWAFFVIFGLACIVVKVVILSLILYAVWRDIADTCGYPADSPFRYVGYCGILFGGSLGGAMIPYEGWEMGLVRVWTEATGVPLNMGVMAVVTIPTTILAITAYVFVSKKLLKVDYQTLQKFDVGKLGKESLVLSPRLKRIIVIYLVTTILCILGNTFIGTGFSALINDTITVAGMYCICTAVLLILPSGEGDGAPCIEFKKVKNSAISWDVIFMVAVTIPLASAVTSDATGIVPWLTGVFEPIFVGKGSLFVLMFTIVVSLILTNIGSNIAFGAAMIPIVAPFVVSSGIDPTFAGAAILYIINIGMVLPGASAPAGIFHAQADIPNGARRIGVTLLACACLAIVAVPMFSIFSLILG